MVVGVVAVITVRRVEWIVECHAGMVGAMSPLAEASATETSQADPGAAATADRVVLVGGDCVLGVALLERWAEAGIAATVIGRVLDGEPTELVGHPVIDVDRHGAVAATLAGADELTILAASGVDDVDGSGIGLADEGLVAAVLLAAAVDPPAHVTVISTALAYDRRTPVVSPPVANVESDPFGLAASLKRLPEALGSRVTLEYNVAQWGDRNNVPVAALRPVLCASLYARGWYDRSGWRTRRLRPAPQPTVQYVHVRDVVAAVETVRSGRCSGPFNVAPDDVLDGPSAAELGDRRLGVGVPSGLLRVLDWVRWLVWWSPTPPSLVRLVGADLVVDSTALGLTGWSATHTSAEAFLVAHAPAWWPSLSARRRQDLVLGGAASVLLAGLCGAGWGIARRWR